ncbi:type A2 lantipeptide [Streptomyces sp. WMMB 322]|uniref:type A2 lantipeptide n=1 Tax=Streptomyces sp. WMMB 322 TaxID=1286821 RepID=UPI0020C80D6E|nr:type A2 lantipeptide [Streptomyces sp. WMMB 322]
MTPQIATAELSDADLDNVSGGVAASVGGNVAAGLDGVAGSVAGSVDGVDGLAGGVTSAASGVAGSVPGVGTVTGLVG